LESEDTDICSNRTRKSEEKGYVVLTNFNTA